MRGAGISFPLLCASLLCCASMAAPQGLTFLHVSDLHVPHAIAETRETIATLPSTPVELPEWGITTSAPAFVLSTGDLNEFGGGRGWWQQYLDLWSGTPIPVYHQLGNHDNTWRCGRPFVRERHGAPFYAFEHSGVKFVGWDTATPQDPRPSIGEEGIRWLAAEFERTPLEQPVIVFLHHSLDGREFAGPYDRSRLLDLLRTRNVILMLVGHGHGIRTWQVEGFDTVMGGSTYGDRRGYGIVSISDGVLRAGYRYVNGEFAGLLEKPVPQRSPFMQMTVEPADGAVLAPTDALRWSVTTDGAPVEEARWSLDGDLSGELRLGGDGWLADLDPAAVEPGAHTLRLEMSDADGLVSSRTVGFFRNGGAFDVAWRRHLGGSCQGGPLVQGDRLFVGDNSGALSILSVSDGSLLGSVQTGGEIRSAPASTADGAVIIFGSADGLLRAIDAPGTQCWEFDTGSAIYGAPLIADGRAYVGNAEGELLALDPATGGLLWRATDAEYSFEQPPAAGRGVLFAGSWDRHAYAFDAATGALRWRRPSAGSDREGFVAWYYSPADCPPAVAGDNVFFADRAYRLTAFSASIGERILDEEKCVAVAAAADGASVHVRHTDGRVSRRSSDGSIIWSAEVPTGAVAAPPIEALGIVWVISDRGTLSALNAGEGSLLGQQRVTADLFAFAPPAFDGERVYVADMSGRVTCFIVNCLRQHRQPEQ
ncbi:MAG: PQQ-binding-like beta-propeller repeat protein [candidate division WS1 bacterium]|nr:PQQ-binding-like beta-propeller repeat protein [candidate division WS1 bacterium]